MLRAAIYTRYSTDLQSAASVEDQIRLCEQHAAPARLDRPAAPCRPGHLRREPEGCRT